MAFHTLLVSACSRNQLRHLRSVKPRFAHLVRRNKMKCVGWDTLYRCSFVFLCLLPKSSSNTKLGRPARGHYLLLYCGGWWFFFLHCSCSSCSCSSSDSSSGVACPFLTNVLANTFFTKKLSLKVHSFSCWGNTHIAYNCILGVLREMHWRALHDNESMHTVADTRQVIC